MEQKLVITLQANGQLNVTGPITNKLLCYGMLESAKMVIQEYKPGKENSIVVPDRLPEDFR